MATLPDLPTLPTALSAEPQSRPRPHRAAAIGHSLALGAVSYVFSESMFWSQWLGDQSVPGVVLTWLVYSVITYLAFAVVRKFGVWSLSGLFLVGAVFGWLVEGGIAGTVFLSPDGVVWTGLAWHAPLTVLFGWYLLPMLLRRGWRSGVLAASGVGLAFGVWSAGYVHDAGGDGPPSLTEYSLYVLGMSLVLLFAYPLHDRWTPPADRKLSRPAVIASGVFVAGWFALAVVIAVPWAAVVLPLLLWLPVWALRGASAPANAHPLFSPPSHPLSVRRCLPLLLSAPVAVAAFVILEPLAGSVPVYVVYALTVPTSAMWLVVSIRRLRRRSPGTSVAHD